MKIIDRVIRWWRGPYCAACRKPMDGVARYLARRFDWRLCLDCMSKATWTVSGQVQR
jgi:hypothetical protein